MLFICPDCKAVFSSDCHLDSCENLLCEGEMERIDQIILEILLDLRDACDSFELRETVNVEGSMTFYTVVLTFFDSEEGLEFLNGCKESLSEEMFPGKISVVEGCDSCGNFTIEISISTLYENFVQLGMIEKIELLFTMVLFFCELFGISTDTRKMYAFLETIEPTSRVVATRQLVRWAPSEPIVPPVVFGSALIKNSHAKVRKN